MMETAYDTLSRRTGVTFGDGSTQAYVWSIDDDLTSLAHAFPNRPADDVTYALAYDQKARQTLETISDAAYRYDPPRGEDLYGADTPRPGIYSSFKGQALTWRPSGALATDGLRRYDYDERGALRRVVDLAASTHYKTYLNDALGRRSFERHYVPGAADPIVRSATDGLRPEVVYESLSEVAEGASTSTRWACATTS